MKLLYNFIFSLIIATSYLNAAQIPESVDAQYSGQKSETIESGSDTTVYPSRPIIRGIGRWITAAIEGDLEAMQELIKVVDVNAQYDNGDTALKIAANEGHEHIVKFLLGVPKINVNLKGRDGETALMMAAFEGHTNIVKLLLQCPDIDVNIQNNDGVHVLNKAVGSANTVKQLLAMPGIKLNLKDKWADTPLKRAIMRGKNSSAKLIQKKLEELITQAYEAIKKRDLKTLKSVTAQIGIDDILDSGIAPMLRMFKLTTFGLLGTDYDTLLDKAFAVNCPEIIFYLLQNSQDPIALLERVPFRLCDSNSPIFQYMLDLAYDKEGNSLLHKAISRNDIDNALILLNNADDPRELLTALNYNGLLPFETISPSTLLFKYIMDLAYCQELSSSVSQVADSSLEATKSEHNSCHNICAYCSKSDCKMRCGRCQAVYYCSLKCQKEHWKSHKIDCKKIN